MNTFKLQRLAFLTFIILLLLFIGHTTIEAILLHNCQACSAPWHVAVVSNALFYGLPLVLLFLLYACFKIKTKKRAAK